MKKHYLGILALSLSLTASAKADQKTYREVGVASYYDDAFNGCVTANGEKFNQCEMTCAHQWLPLGTMVKVTNLKNHKTVVLRVNDRGPYFDGRMIDLSKSAAAILGYTDEGLAMVQMETMNFKNYMAWRSEDFEAGRKLGYGRNNKMVVECVAVKNRKLPTLNLSGSAIKSLRPKLRDGVSARIEGKHTFNYLIFFGVFYRPEKVSAFHDERHPKLPDTGPRRYFEDRRSVAWIAP